MHTRVYNIYLPFSRFRSVFIFIYYTLLFFSRPLYTHIIMRIDIRILRPLSRPCVSLRRVPYDDNCTHYHGHPSISRPSPVRTQQQYAFLLFRARAFITSGVYCTCGPMFKQCYASLFIV